jgi:hypothetical protein
VLAELVTDVLAGPGGEVPSHLRPLADGLVSMRRPQSGVVWLRRSAITRQTLRDLAHGRIPRSHAALDAAGTSRAVEYLRCLLVRYGVLPPRDRRLADFQRWAATKLDALGDAEHRQVLGRFLRWYLLRHLRSGSTTATPLSHGPYQRAKQRLTVAAAFLAWLAGRGHQLGECTQHDLDSWFAAGPSTRQHALTFLSWARRQRILRGIELPVIHTEAGAPPPAPAVRLAAIRRPLLNDALALDDRIAGCLVVLYGQQASRIAALRITEVSCTDAATRLRPGADWLDVPEPVATLLRHHLRNRRTMTTAANPASPWPFPGQLAGEQRSYRRLIVSLSRLGIPARASRLAAWRQLVRQAPPAVLAGALGVSPDTATRHALLAGADWATYASRRSSLATPEYDGLPISEGSSSRTRGRWGAGRPGQRGVRGVGSVSFSTRLAPSGPPGTGERPYRCARYSAVMPRPWDHRSAASGPTAAVSIKIRALPPASVRHTWSPCTTGRSRSSTITS